MCGFAGFFTGAVASPSADWPALLQRMGDAIRHRGPDDSGVWVDENVGMGLVHRRLSILDLSAAGHQPMSSASGRYVIAFNGEIYNHLEIRAALEQLSPLSAINGSICWRGHSDTETLLAGFDVFGIEDTLKRCVGMFAFAVWDCDAKTLTLGRDRVGEKPLYYGWQGSGDERVFLFGSELKALKAHSAFRAGIDRGALSLLLRYNYIPAPYSIYQGIAKLEPGCLLTISLQNIEPDISRYWSGIQVARSGVAKPFTGSPAQAVDELEDLLKNAVCQQMMADVPLGAFLSGGVDSSALVALMQAHSSLPVKTFSLGFDEQGFNEAEYAKAVSQHLGTAHSELYVTPQDAIKVIPRLPGLYCEPLADSSQIPTFLVSQLARQHVTVSLSGDGGDELFCGYSRYQLTAELWQKLALVPAPLRAFAARVITALPPTTWDRLAGFIPGSRRFNEVGDKLHKGADVLASRTADELYMEIISHQRSPMDLVIGGHEPPTHLTGLRPNLESLSAVERMMVLDLISYLPGDILAKLDRAAMGVSLESRVPFLDHRVVEFAWTLPLDYKLRDGQTKWPLRQVLYRHVPRDLIDRPKKGFSIPLHDWLRGPLRGWAEALLDPSRLHREGYFHPSPILKLWAEHLSGKRNWTAQLWGVLMFQAWLERE